MDIHYAHDKMVPWHDRCGIRKSRVWAVDESVAGMQGQSIAE